MKRRDLIKYISISPLAGGAIASGLANAAPKNAIFILKVLMI